jgi:hypothetical protein
MTTPVTASATYLSAAATTKTTTVAAKVANAKSPAVVTTVAKTAPTLPKAAVPASPVKTLPGAGNVQSVAIAVPNKIKTTSPVVGNSPHTVTHY